MCKNCLLNEEDETFLEEREEAMNLSGARVLVLRKDTEELKKEVEVTSKKLSFLL